MKTNTFESYVKLSNIDNGLVAPIEMYSDTNIIRMLLDTKELIVNFGKNLTLSFIDINTGNVEKIGTVHNRKELETLFDKIKSVTYDEFHYSLENLKNSL